MAHSSSHGEVKAYWKAKQLIIEPNATFNIEGIIKATQIVKHQIDERPLNNWVRVVHFKNELSAGPVEGAKYVLESIQYGYENGCKLVCVVGGNALNKEGFKKVCKLVGLPLYFFEDLDAVERFVLSVGELSAL